MNLSDYSDEELKDELDRRQLLRIEKDNEYLDYLKKRGGCATPQEINKLHGINASLWGVYDSLLKDGRIVEEKGEWGAVTIKLGKKVENRL